MNSVYKRAFPVYKILYFFYKRISDRGKIRLIRKWVRPGMTAIDVGANIGFYTMRLSRLVGETGRVIAYEPEGRNFSLLKRITRKRSNIVLRQAACGERAGALKLYVSADMNIDHQTYDADLGREIQEVPCVAVDEDLDEWERVGFIKIDIQGYDYFALKGMKRIIQRSPELLVFGEFWPYALKKAGVEPSEYIRSLEEWGLKVQFFRTKEDPLHLDREDDKYFYADFYASKPDPV